MTLSDEELAYVLPEASVVNISFYDLYNFIYLKCVIMICIQVQTIYGMMTITMLECVLN